MRPASLRGFFSNYSFADPATDQAKCTDIGGTFLNHPELGEICSTSAPSDQTMTCSASMLAYPSQTAVVPLSTPSACESVATASAALHVGSISGGFKVTSFSIISYSSHPDTNITNRGTFTARFEQTHIQYPQLYPLNYQNIQIAIQTSPLGLQYYCPLIIGLN